MDETLTFLRAAARVVLSRRRARLELEALSERHLADIGLDRLDVAAHVRSGWPWPALPGPRSRLRPSLRGCG